MKDWTASINKSSTRDTGQQPTGSETGDDSQQVVHLMARPGRIGNHLALRLALDGRSHGRNAPANQQFVGFSSSRFAPAADAAEADLLGNIHVASPREHLTGKSNCQLWSAQ